MASQLGFNSKDIESLVIVHRRRHDDHFNNHDVSFDFAQKTWVFWETCVRRIAFGHTDFDVEKSMHAGDEIYQGDKAYEFLLQVICGLHSPVKGETEVQGQFKAFSENLEKGWLKNVLKLAYAESKVIRDAHLRGLGSQSYGSITRRKVRECSQVDIVGGGHLLREILPWLLKLDTKVNVYVREPKKLADLILANDKKATSQLDIFSLDESPKSLGGLLIMAPISSRDLKKWAGPTLTGAELVMDFRAESAKDPIEILEEKTGKYLPLKIIFDEIDAVKGRVEEQVAKAQKHIREIAYAPQNRRAQK